MDKINADGNNKFFDLNNINWEQEFSNHQAFFESESDKFSTEEGRWNKIETSQAEDDLIRQETKELGEKLRDYAPVFVEPNWEVFKEEMEEKAQKKQFFFISKAAEVYLLLAFCALIAFWGGKSGIFTSESGVNWAKLSEISPFIASTIFGEDKEDLIADNHSRTILATNKTTNENQADLSFINISGFDRNIQNLIPLKDINYIPNVVDKSEVTIMDWRKERQNSVLEDRMALAPLGKSAINLNPYLKIGGNFGVVNIITPMAAGDFGRSELMGGAGIRAGVSLGDKWEVETGLDYQKLRYGGVNSGSNDLDIVSIPLNVRYKIAEPREGLSVSVIGGVASNHVVAGKYEKIRQVSPSFPIEDLGPQEASQMMVVKEGAKARSQFTSVMVGVGVERKIDSLSTVFANMMYTTTVGGGFGRNFERGSGVGIELGVRVSI